MQKFPASSDAGTVFVVNNLFFENRSPLLKKYPQIFWFLLGLVCLGTSVYLFLETRAVVFIRTALPLSTGIILVPFGIKLGANLFNKWGFDVGNFVTNPTKEVRYWFANEVAVFAGTRSMVNCGLLTGVASTVAFSLGGVFSNLETSSRLGLALIIFVAGFFSWVGVYNVFCLSRIIWRLGRFNVKVEADPFGVMTTGKTLVKCYYIGAVIWCVFTSSATVGMRAGWIPMIALAVPSIVFFIASFVVCQIPLHNKMVSYKKIERSKIKEMLDSLTPHALIDLTDARQQRIEFLEKRLANTIDLPEWPFGWKSLLGAIISSVASVIPTLLSLSIEAVKAAFN